MVRYPKQMVTVDIVGPLHQSTNDNSYLLVAEDYFTKWLEAWLNPNQETKTVKSPNIYWMICSLDFH